MQRPLLKPTRMQKQAQNEVQITAIRDGNPHARFCRFVEVSSAQHILQCFRQQRSHQFPLGTAVQRPFEGSTSQHLFLQFSFVQLQPITQITLSSISALSATSGEMLPSCKLNPQLSQYHFLPLKQPSGLRTQGTCLFFFVVIQV